MELLLIFLLLTLTAAALFYLKKVLDGQTEILRRLELLELVSREGVPVDRVDAGHPHDGLPIGAPFPDFALKNVAGETVSLDTVLSTGRPSVFFFVSPTCEPCKALLPEIERWEAELGERLNLVFVSSGDAEANAGKFAIFSDDVLLQEKRELAESVHARWTPTALLVRADGTIGSHVAAGDIAIGKLIEHVRKGGAEPDAYFISDNGNGSRPPKIGQKVPDFKLEDIAGNPIDSEELKGRRTVAVFWSLTCPYCKAMMDDLKKWDASRDDGDPSLIVFSDGDREEHLDLGLKAPVVLDAGYKTSEELGMFGTPSAVIIDETGTIVTETAMGASNIWALIGKRK
jgi:thiol-disulfide isomerase/thioredoxin